LRSFCHTPLYFHPAYQSVFKFTYELRETGTAKVRHETERSPWPGLSAISKMKYLNRPDSRAIEYTKINVRGKKFGHYLGKRLSTFGSHKILLTHLEQQVRKRRHSGLARHVTFTQFCTKIRLGDLRRSVRF
jgi:hypothetical protein